MHGGITDMSLRELAAAIGTSHRMLLYHFGSREGLLNAVVRAVEGAQRAAVSEWGISLFTARRLWPALQRPAAVACRTAVLQLYAHALLGRPGTEGFWTARSSHGWPRSRLPSLRKPGWTARTARLKPGSPSLSPAGCCSTCSRPATATAFTEAFERATSSTPKPSSASPQTSPSSPARHLASHRPPHQSGCGAGLLSG